MAQRQYKDKVVTKKRLLWILCVLSIVFAALLGRLGFVMIYKSQEYKGLAINQWTSEVKIWPKRGRILDEKGQELAVSANVFRVDVDLNAIRDFITAKGSTNNFDMGTISKLISDAVGMDNKEVNDILTKKLANGKNMGSANIKRRVEKDAADKAKDLKIGKLSVPGILVSSDTKRYYPNGNFLAHVLGHTNSDGEGLTGVELQYNSFLTGMAGFRIAETDRKSNDLPNTISEYQKPVNGSDLTLTIDEMIQNFAEKSAMQALSDNKAKAVSILVTNPKTGEILAMVNKPDYNPNEPWTPNTSFDDLQKIWRNRLVSDAFEPGSILKVVTSATALNLNMAASDKYVCVSSGFTVGGKAIRCANDKVHGVQNLQDMLKNSCNQAFAQLGLKIGKENFNNSIAAFGFGKKTGIDLPGEASGIIKKTSTIIDADLARMAFGQVNAITLLQYMEAFNSVANGGKLIPLHVMRDLSHIDETTGSKIIDKSYSPDIKNVGKPEEMAVLRALLEKVVSEGGGQKAFIEGYHIAGKTGTAQKAIGGVYAPGKYIASFAGMAPASDPQISIIVSIDEPDPAWYYAGQIATPVAKQVFYDIFNYKAINIDANSADVSKSLLRDIIIPEVRGLKKSEALKLLKDAGLGNQIDTNGDYVVEMSPKPGYNVKEGSKIVLYTGNGQSYNKVVAVPNLKGVTTERAAEILNAIGLKSKFNSSGIITEQNIEALQEVTKGTLVSFEAEPIGD